jgi:hypothetical protein
MFRPLQIRRCMRRFRAQDQKGNEPPGPCGLQRRLVCFLGSEPASGRLGWRQSYLLARFERLELERRFESDVLLRRVERVVLREAVRRFVPVLRRAVDLRGLDLRAVDLRPDDRRVVLRDAVLRPVLLRPVDLRPVLLRPEVFRALEDLRVAPVLPVRSRRFARR